jgi:hypothetical protein
VPLLRNSARSKPLASARVNGPDSARAKINTANECEAASVETPARTGFAYNIVAMAGAVVGANNPDIDIAVAMLVDDTADHRVLADLYGLIHSEGISGASEAERGDPPAQAEVITAGATGVVPNPNHGGISVSSRRRRQKDNLSAAVSNLEVEPMQVRPWERFITLRSVVAGLATGKRPDGHQVAADRDLGFLIDLKTDVTLPLSTGHVIAGDSPRPKLSICHDRHD